MTNHLYIGLYCTILITYIVWCMSAYFSIEYSQTVVYSGVIFSAILLAAVALYINRFKIHIKSNTILSQLLAPAVAVLLSLILPLPSINKHVGGSWVYTFAIVVSATSCIILFLALSKLSSDSDNDLLWERIKKIYLYFWILNTIVSLAQNVLFFSDIIGKDFYVNNPRLEMIILPSFGVGSEKLRTPGLFYNGATNAFFYSLGLLYFASMKDAIKRHLQSPILFIFFMASTGVIYLTYTRRVWAALLLTYAAITLFKLLLKLNVKSILKVIGFSGIGLLLLIVLSAYIVITSNFFSQQQVLNNESIIERTAGWAYHLSILYNSSAIQLALGNGILQNLFHLYEDSFPFFIDNIFASLLLYSGIFGLCCYLWFYAKLVAMSFAPLGKKESRQGYLEGNYFNGIFSAAMATFCIVLSMAQIYWVDFYMAVTTFFILIPYLTICAKQNKN